MDIISETKSNYYSYFYYLENYSIAQSSLSRAQYLLEINRARYQKGLVSSVDLLETEAVVAQREKGLIAAEFALKKAEDKLKYITNLVDNPTLWNAEVKLVNRPQFKVVEPDLTESLKDAFEFRPDYESAQIDLASRDIKIKTAKNALFPTVDLVGSFGLNSLGKDYEEAIDKIDSDYKDWSVAVEFSLPWGAGDRAEYDQKKLEKAQALLELKRLEQTIILEIRDKVREVNTQCRQVKAAKLAKEKEEQNYQAQEERYATGYVSTHDILEYQDRLAQAELDYIKGLIDYNVAIIELEESQGLTLARNDIILEGK
jgi:outer membrane protein TolC